jgi:hypothetical protein
MTPVDWLWLAACLVSAVLSGFAGYSMGYVAGDLAAGRPTAYQGDEEQRDTDPTPAPRLDTTLPSMPLAELEDLPDLTEHVGAAARLSERPKGNA